MEREKIFPPHGEVAAKLDRIMRFLGLVGLIRCRRSTVVRTSGSVRPPDEPTPVLMRGDATPRFLKKWSFEVSCLLFSEPRGAREES